MRKEVLIAIIIGFGLGLVITFGIWTANKALKKPEGTIPVEVKEEVENTPTPAPSIDLSIVSPEDNTISDKEKIEISGKTIPGGILAIVYPDGEKILEADENGNFSTEISLIGGDNLVKISAFDKDGNEATKSLTIVYTTAKI